MYTVSDSPRATGEVKWANGGSLFHAADAVMVQLNKVPLGWDLSDASPAVEAFEVWRAVSLFAFI